MHVRWTECKICVARPEQGSDGSSRMHVPLGRFRPLRPNSNLIVLWIDRQGVYRYTVEAFGELIEKKHVRVGATVTLKEHLALEDQFKTLGYDLEVKQWSESSTPAPRLAAPAKLESLVRQHSKQPAPQTQR